MGQIITSQFNVATVEKGENSIYLDLSNDNDSILYIDGAAKNTCVTTITLYDGAKDVTAQAVVTHTATGCTVTKSGRTYTVTAITGDNVKGTVLISAAYNGQNYSNTFTVTKLVDKDRYELICSPNSVTVNTTTGAKSASAIKVEIYKTPYTTGIRAKLNTLDGGHSLKYYVNNGVSPTAISYSGGSGSFNVDANNSSYRVVLASGDVELDSETIPINKSENGVDGENAVRIDISNEMDMIPTTTARLISAARTVETIVRLFDGSSEVNISTATLSPAGGPASTIATFSQTASGKGKKLSWAFIAGQTMAEAYEIVISYTYNSVSYSATFTVCASKGEAVWQLQPSMSAIPFQRNSDNTLTPASQNVGLTLLKIDGGSTDTYTQVQTGLTVRYSTSSMPSSATAGTGWSSGNISVPNTATNLYIAMFNSSGTLLDRETVPVVKDGEKGDDGTDGYGVVLVLFRNIYSEEQWNEWAVVGQSDNYSKQSGDDDFLKCRVGDFFMTTGTATNSGKRHTAIWKCTAVTASLITGICVSHVTDGDPGSTGHAGRWYYFAGDFDGTADHYQMDETQAPYVKYNGKFWMLDFGGEEPTSFPKKASQTPSASSTEWTEMQSAHKYYIAQAFFGENAYLGSFIINGDWMITKYGLIYDTSGGAHPIDNTHSYSGYNIDNAYTLFNANYPNSSRFGYLNFCPAWAVDGLVGRQYHNGTFSDGSNFKAGSVSIDDDGFSVLWGGEGIKVGSSGLQRYDDVRQTWLPMFNKRNIVVDKYKRYGRYTLPPEIDYFVNAYAEDGYDKELQLPSSSSLPDGAVITVRGWKALCFTDVYPASGDRLALANDDNATFADVDGADRVDFVLCKSSSTGFSYNTWLVNYYDRTM